MDYEQKYTKALWQMKELYNRVKYMSSTEALFVSQTLENTFPELKESEDERIRKGLIKGLTAMKEIHHHSTFSDDAIEIADAIAWLEKQGEQKASWSEEDEDALDIAIRIIQNGGDDCAGILDSDKALKWLKSLKDRIQPQPKQEWSEYDKIQLSEAIQMIEANGTWIRSEDAVKKVSNWLKSLKPNHWKPSEEQMESLKKRTHGLHESSETRKALESLINDLKKL